MLSGWLATAAVLAGIAYNADSELKSKHLAETEAVSDAVIEVLYKWIATLKVAHAKCAATRISMPFFQGIALQDSRGLSEAAGAFVPASAAAAAASIAETLAHSASTKLQATKRPKRPAAKKKPKPLTEDILQWGRNIGLHDVCWMRPLDSPTDFAHICVIIQEGDGNACMNYICVTFFCDTFCVRFASGPVQAANLRFGD